MTPRQLLSYSYAIFKELIKLILIQTNIYYEN